MGLSSATKKTLITVENTTQLVIRRAKRASAWCPVCGAEVEAIAFNADARSEPDTAAHFQQWLGIGRLHICRSAEGITEVCVPFLFDACVG
jgi:hypothetical protein